MVSFKELIEDSKETFGDSSSIRLTISERKMESTTRRQVLLKAIHERLEEAYDDTLEDVI